MVKLKLQSLRATGTVRETECIRQQNNEITDLKKRGRCDQTVHVAQRNNNIIIHIAGNYNTDLPVHKCKRRGKGTTLDVTQLHLIAQCNKGMGGVHLLDLFLSLYRPTICGKKWYWPLFAKHVNITGVAAWRSHCPTSNTKLSHLEFLGHITMTLIQSESPGRVKVPKGAT